MRNIAVNLSILSYLSFDCRRAWPSKQAFQGPADDVSYHLVYT